VTLDGVEDTVRRAAIGDVLSQTEAALDWALGTHAGVDNLGRVDSIYRDANGSWRRHEVPADLSDVLEQARRRILAARGWLDHG
jgi:hypothetical protein